MAPKTRNRVKGIKPFKKHVSGKEKMLHTALNPGSRILKSPRTRQAWRGTPDPRKDRLVADVENMIAEQMAMQQVNEKLVALVDSAAGSMQAVKVNNTILLVNDTPQTNNDLMLYDQHAMPQLQPFLLGNGNLLLAQLFAYKNTQSLFQIAVAQNQHGRPGWLPNTLNDIFGQLSLIQLYPEPTYPKQKGSRVAILGRGVDAAEYTKHLKTVLGLDNMRLGNLQREIDIHIDRTLTRGSDGRLSPVDGLRMNATDVATARFKIYQQKYQNKQHSEYPTVLFDLLLPVQGYPVRQRKSIQLSPFTDVIKSGTVRPLMLHVKFAFVPAAQLIVDENRSKHGYRQHATKPGERGLIYITLSLR
jgi:hypothetical protein